MPTYEYECKACQSHMEIFQSMKDDPLKKCPECGKNKLKRLIGSGAGIIFKGNGFYCTDYRSDHYQKDAKKDKSDSSSKSSTTKSDSGKSKSEKKTPSKSNKNDNKAA